LRVPAAHQAEPLFMDANLLREAPFLAMALVMPRRTCASSMQRFRQLDSS
jgi:hypothetical protein